jgi:hypothetical protein
VDGALNLQQLLDVCVDRRAQCAAESLPPLDLRTKQTTGIMARVAPPDHPEAIHERKEFTLAEQLLVNDSERSQVGIRAAETTLH